MPKDKCIHQLFEEQVGKTPLETAVVFEGEKYTYKEIDRMANSLANLLRKKGVGRGDIVAIIARRSYLVIVAQFAVLKAGGAYLPIDPNYPEARIEHMLNETNSRIILALGTETASEETIQLDKVDYSFDTSRPENINEYEDLCYIIFTSGSTGLPKGVMASHAGIINYSNNNNNNNNNNNIINAVIESGIKKIVSITTIGFDIFVTESLFPLLNGMTVIMANDIQISEQKAFNRLVIETNAEVLQTTPSKIQMLMADDKNVGWLNHINIICLGGEVLKPKLVKEIDELSNARIHNVYGATEGGVWSTYFQVNRKRQCFNLYGTTETTIWCSNAVVAVDNDITIGKPIANTQIFILDKHMKPLPIGAVGELCISGAGVCRGYINSPELTTEKFIDNPFSDGKMYRTGDLARWREDGNIEYIGRMDNQVKIRGLRIELGEIEYCINESDRIKQSVVVVKTDESGRQYICAYYKGNDVEIKAIKAAISKKLPQYMMPHFFIPMEKFPTTTSGKTDREALPAPDFENVISGTEYAAPETDGEKTIAVLIEKTLGVKMVGRNDNFFDIGGDSLKAIELVSKAHSKGLYFTLQYVFEHPTPALLAKYREGEGFGGTVYDEESIEDLSGLLEKNIKSEYTIAEEKPLGDVIITGATGWLGAHVLDRFLSFEKGIAYCLVRGTNPMDSRGRLAAVLETYFDGRYTNCNRIVPICGDITEPLLLNQPINTVIHCAAIVKHYGSYQNSYDINVNGTRNVIELAKEKGARLLHVSTASVSGKDFDIDSGFSPTCFDETKLYIGQPLKNVYIRSKFEAEKAVLRAKAEGLDAWIFRVGNLSNRYTDLRFQNNLTENAILTRLKAFVDLGEYPREMEDFPLEFSPVDETAGAIIKLAQHFDNYYSVFHVYHPKAPRFVEFVRAAYAAGFSLNPVPVEQFVNDVLNTANIQASAHIHEAFINDIEADKRINLGGNITLNNDFTTWYLNKAGFEWGDIERGYIEKYIRYFDGIGFWGKLK